MNADPAFTAALRNSQPMPTEKSQLLHDTTLSMVRNNSNGRYKPLKIKSL
jgi:hypothetical protein